MLDRKTRLMTHLLTGLRRGHLEKATQGVIPIRLAKQMGMVGVLEAQVGQAVVLVLALRMVVHLVEQMEALDMLVGIHQVVQVVQVVQLERAPVVQAVQLEQALVVQVAQVEQALAQVVQLEQALAQVERIGME